MKHRDPDFFIIGAPKSGTTALDHYLGCHPSIYMYEPKEPHFFATDLPDSIRVCRDPDVYFGAFGKRKERLCGESSVFYLYSHEAVRNILDHNPQAKFIVLIRDPVRMAVSWHNQSLKVLNEDVEDFERAWRLQEARRQGAALPTDCKTPLYLQYEDICKIGSQLERAMAIVPASQLLVIRQDWLLRNTRDVYLNVLDFLGVDDDGRTEFATKNESGRLRSRAIQKLIGIPFPFRNRLGRVLHKFGIYPRLILRRLNMRPLDRAAISEEFVKELRDAFRSEVELLERCLGEDLSQWSSYG